MTTLLCALALALAQAAAPDKSPTTNNGANREAAGPPTQDQELAAVPGGPATPKPQWKTGDPRGNPLPTARGIAQARGKRSKKTGQPDARVASPASSDRGADRSEHRRAKAADQARGRNAKGSLSRPADSPAQINRSPKAIGSGAPPGQAPEAGGKNYGRRRMEGNAGGVASGEDNPGGSAPQGASGKSKRTQPADHQAGEPRPEPK